MTEHDPVVVERDSNGTFSAWVAGPKAARLTGRKGGRPRKVAAKRQA